MTTTDLIKNTRKFIIRAKDSGRMTDVAYGFGALDALEGRPADGTIYGPNLGSYLAGWTAAHGI